ncbi:MAG: hypothetical protein KAI81_04655, partial [Candidatus Marinimicrobia bacterium]|nr:hypothetical protein [Candidatus Neomarinimicrobiota bacterium]
DIHYNKGRTDSKQVIEEYPQSSSNDLENIYFYSLLPECYGDKVDLNFDYSRIHGDVGFCLKHFSYHPYVAVGQTLTDLKINEEHLNTSSTRQAGLRFSELPISIVSRRYEIGLSRGGNSLSLIYETQETDEIWRQSDAVDHGDMNILSDGQLQHKNSFIKYESSHKMQEMILTAGRGTLNSSLMMSTPVLGYIDFFQILPISHQLYADFEANYTLQAGRIRKSIKRGPLVFWPGIHFLHSRIQMNSIINSELEYGLMNIENSEELFYDIQLYNMEFQVEYSLKSVALHIEMNQLIPWIREMSPGIGLPPPADEKKNDFYGGLHLQAGIKFYL